MNGGGGPGGRKGLLDGGGAGPKLARTKSPAPDARDRAEAAKSSPALKRRPMSGEQYATRASLLPVLGSTT